MTTSTTSTTPTEAKPLVLFTQREIHHEGHVIPAGTKVPGELPAGVEFSADLITKLMKERDLAATLPPTQTVIKRG